jgi:large subunit ribosomal protein L10
MAITRKEKEETLAALTEELKQARGVVFTEYRGLTVKQLDKVRKNLRKENVNYKVVKVTLLKKALAALGISTDSLKYNGPIAVASSKDEETTPARILKGMLKENPQLIMDGGILESKLIGSDVVATLAALPSKQQLLGQLVSVIAGPMRGLVTVLSGNTRNLLNVLNAIKEKKG